MRWILMFGCLLLGSSVQAQDLSKVRNAYYEAVNNAGAAGRLYTQLKEERSSDPLIIAYFGATQALKARFSWNPYHKLSYLSEGLTTLGTAVDKSPENLEIRFLRFSLVHFIPSFLGYGRTLEPDKAIIVELVSKRKWGLIDPELLKNLIQFMKESGRCTPAELAILNKATRNG